MDKGESAAHDHDAPVAKMAASSPPSNEVPVGVLVDLSDDKEETMDKLASDLEFDSWDPTYSYVEHRALFNFTKHGLSTSLFEPKENDSLPPSFSEEPTIATPQFTEEPKHETVEDNDDATTAPLEPSPPSSICDCFRCQFRGGCCAFALKERVRKLKLQPSRNLNNSDASEDVSNATSTDAYYTAPQNTPVQGSSKMMCSAAASRSFSPVTGQSSSENIAEGAVGYGRGLFTFGAISMDKVPSEVRRQQTEAWILQQHAAETVADLPSAFAEFGIGKNDLRALRRPE